jgi:hypothetical protein
MMIDVIMEPVGIAFGQLLQKIPTKGALSKLQNRK